MIFRKAIVMLSGLAFLHAPSNAETTGKQKGLATFTSRCVSAATQSLPALNTAQVQSVCTCAKEKMGNLAMSLSDKDPESSWLAAESKAITPCVEPIARQSTLQQCLETKAVRADVRTRFELSDLQYDQYCHCHINLTYDEAARGLNAADPKSAQVIMDKSAKLCLGPIKTGAYKQ